jgi:hypothetical protein
VWCSPIVTIVETSHSADVTIAYIGPCIVQPLALGLVGLSSLSGAQRQWLEAPAEASRIQEPINPSNDANWKLTESNTYELCKG